MTLQKQLRDDQDDQRSKQLDLREKAIKKREALLDDSSRINRLDILDKQIAQKESMRTSLEEDIKNLTARKEEIDSSSSLKSAVLTNSLSEQLKEIDLAKEKEKSIASSIKYEEKRLRDIKQDIQTQSDYLKKEQIRIDQVVNEWNNQLKEFREEGLKVQQSKEKVSLEIIVLEGQKKDLENEVEVLSVKSDDLDEAYSSKVQDYKEELRTLKAQVQDSEQQLLELELKTKARIDAADVRDKQVAVRERSIQQKEFDLISKEKSLNMKVGLSQMSIE